jgi:hypothetical protein
MMSWLFLESAHLPFKPRQPFSTAIIAAIYQAGA